MTEEQTVQAVIQQYLDAVVKAAQPSPEYRQTLVTELREHIDASLQKRTSGQSATLKDVYAVLAGMDSPETYAESSASSAPSANPKLVALLMICSVMQIFGLVAVIVGIPLIGALAGFAAVVNFFIIWSKQTPVRMFRLAVISGLCGLGLIVLDMIRWL